MGFSASTPVYHRNCGTLFRVKWPASFTRTLTVALTLCRVFFSLCVGTRCPPPPCPQVPEKRQGLLSGKHAAPRGSPCFRENRFLTSSRAKTSSYADLSSGKENKERLPTVAIRYDGDRTTVSMVMHAIYFFFWALIVS